uniref:Uncharacterized protein n=1 Tax=Arundo donax TaxID=35708 RepID=A0A0A8Z9R4_ARUDO
MDSIISRTLSLFSPSGNPRTKWQSALDTSSNP